MDLTSITVLFLLVMFVLWKIVSVIGRQQPQIVQDKDTVSASKNQIDLLGGCDKIKERSVEIAGTYAGNPISKHVVLENGRVFEFESLAVMTREGIFSSTEADRLHILVDNYLLYKLVE